jgi:hypothetical protein
MIVEVTNPLQIPAVCRLAHNIPDVPVDKMRSILIEAMSKDIAKILLAKKDGKMLGFIFAMITEFDGEDVAFVQTCYISPEAKSVGKEMLSIIDKWGKEKKVKDILMITKRNPKAYERKYGFTLESYVMKRSVSNE